MTALFSSSQLIQKKRAPERDRRERRRIPTGAPRLVESTSDRLDRAEIEAWTSLIEAVRRSSEIRLDLLTGRDGGDPIACPWERLVACDSTCRCRGSRTVTVDFLRDHYARLANEIAKIATRSS